MSICRDTNGKLAYLTKTNNGVFSIHKGENKILRHPPYKSTEARIYSGTLGGDPLPRFSSFYTAVKFFKSNIDRII